MMKKLKHLDKVVLILFASVPFLGLVAKKPVAHQAGLTEVNVNMSGVAGHTLAPTPPMGWNSWNWFGKTNVNETVVREVIDAMAKNGLRDAGYDYIVVDGGWRDTKLGPNGELLANPVRFPHGIKVLADYAHSKGFKFGLHTVPGTADCGGDPVGGFGHEEVQIKQFIDWGLDFIKLDKCRYADGWNEDLLEKTYRKWATILKQENSHIVLSISAYKFRDWNPEVGNMSRTTRDIGAKTNGGASLETVPGRKRGSVMGIAEENNKSAKYARPGYWNDPDMMVTGEQGLTPDEQKIHFALWGIMSSPLFLGDDPRNMPQYEKDIVMNKEAIQIDQDPTEQGTQLKVDGDTQIWAKKLKGGKVAVLFINLDHSAPKTITLDLKALGIAKKVDVKDVYAHKSLGKSAGQISQPVKPRSCLYMIVE